MNKHCILPIANSEDKKELMPLIAKASDMFFSNEVKSFCLMEQLILISQKQKTVTSPDLLKVFAR